MKITSQNTKIIFSNTKVTVFASVTSAGEVLSYTITELLTTTGAATWVKPAGITSLTVECYGAGGAGGGGISNPAGGSGGAGGQYARKIVTYDGAQFSISYTVGAAGVASQGDGLAGGNTTWNTSDVIAVGGAGGTANAGLNQQVPGGVGSTVGGVGDVVYAGGNGSIGESLGPEINASYGGSGGGAAGSNGNGTTGLISGPGSGGAGGGGFAGNGGDGVSTNGAPVNGNPGNIYGGGGSGGATFQAQNCSGGAGAQGLIRVSYSIPPPLDLYTGSSAAFSVRKLTDSATYCMQVRRSNDNATQDIGFQSDGLIDTGSLLSFVGSNTGYVNIWYNQADIQTNFNVYTGSAVVPLGTTIEAPYIVNAGSLVTQNGKPAVFYNALAGLYAETVLTNASGLWSTFAVAQVADTTTRLLVRTVLTGTNIAQNIRRNTTNIESIGFNSAAGNGTDLGPSNPGTTQFIAYAERTSADVEVYVNGATNGATAVAGTPAVSNVRGVGSQIHIGFFGGSGPPTFPWSGTIQEVIHYPQDPATFNYRVGLTTSLNSFYGTF